MYTTCVLLCVVVPDGFHIPGDQCAGQSAGQQDMSPHMK